MKQARFRLPSEMKPDETRVPLSMRIKATSRDFLEKKAKSAGLSLAELTANVIEDYVLWIKESDHGPEKKK